MGLRASSELAINLIDSKLVADRTHPGHERASQVRTKPVHAVSAKRDGQGKHMPSKSPCDRNGEDSQDMSEHAKLEQAQVELAARDARLEGSERELQEVESELARSKSQTLKEKVVMFKPGAIGMKANWDSGLITNIKPGGQAEQLGVKSGWTLSRLEDTHYTEQRFDALLAGHRSFSITFITRQSASDAQKVAATSDPYPHSAALLELLRATRQATKERTSI